MKHFLFIIVLWPMLLHAESKSGKQLVDSLESELASARQSKLTDTVILKILGDLSYELSLFDAGKSIKYAEQMVAMTEGTKWLEGKAFSYSSLGAAYLAKSDDSIGVAYLLRALEVAEEAKNKLSIASVLGNLGSYYRSTGNYTKALQYMFRGLKIDEEFNNRVLIARDLLNIGTIYMGTEKYDKANEYFLKAAKVKEELGDKTGLANCMANLSASYSAMDSNKNAVEYALKAQKLYEEIGNPYGVQVALANAGSAYMQLGNMVNALEYEFAALKLDAQVGSKPNLASITDVIGTIYLTLAKDSSGKTPKNQLIPGSRSACLAMASKYFEQSVNIGKEINDMSSYLPVLQHLSEVYQLMGNYKAALTYQQLYMQTKDSVFNLENNIKITNLETQREKELKEKQIIIDRLEVEKKRKERVFYIIGIAVLLVVVGIIARYYRRQLVTNRLLKEEKVKSDGLMMDLSESLKQKDMLMKEIHHRVKNNLQLISALLDLQLDVVHEDSKDAMTESAMRVRSISLIHQQLYQNEDITSIEFSQFVQDMVRHLSSAFTRPGQDIALQSNIPEIMFDIDTAVPLGLILNELMTNSFKYAFAGKNGYININLSGSGDTYELTYADSGPGMPDNYNIDESDSLGLRVIRGLSSQLGGSMAYDMEHKQFRISFIP